MKKHHPKKINGTPASSGIGRGTAWILQDEELIVRPEKINREDVDFHLEKFEKALKKVRSDFDRLKELTDDEDVSEIIEAQIQTLIDPELHSMIEEKIKENHYGVVYAIFSTINDYIQLMEQSGAEWLHERTIDLVSIRDQLIQATKKRKKEHSVQKEAVVLATNVSPTAMVQLSQLDISGIVMEHGGLTSHAVILSQSLGIPCIVAAPWKRLNIQNGTEVLIDGETGEIVFYPDQSEKKIFKKREKDQQEALEKTLEWIQKPNKTHCGKTFTLQANVEFLEELPRISKFGAKGVGLLRTETILFQSERFNVDDQVEFYTQVAEAAGKDTVTVRLFDAGGDKLLENVDAEANPFLGWRGVRMLLDEENLLQNQLEAIYRVSGQFPGRLKLLIPMISGLEELLTVKDHIRVITKKLKKQSVAIDENVPVGIMVEVPSTAVMAETFARHADFFSIGTNDLIQYTLAVDRGNDRISTLFEPNHPAIWRLISQAKQGAEAHNVPVVVCGEMASDPVAAACLMGMGIHDLSMNTGAIPRVKSVLCTHNMNQMKELARKVLQADKTSQIDDFFESWR